MKFENSEHQIQTTMFYCEGCKRKTLSDNIFVEYSSLINDFKNGNHVLYRGFSNDNLQMDNTDSNSESDEESQVLLKDSKLDINFKLWDNIEDQNLEIEVLKRENKRLNKEIENSSSAMISMDEFYSESSFTLAIRRLPALFLTLIIELIGGVIISDFQVVIRKYTLLVSFMPALSALSGKFFSTIVCGLNRHFRIGVVKEM